MAKLTHSPMFDRSIRWPVAKCPKALIQIQRKKKNFRNSVRLPGVSFDTLSPLDTDIKIKTTKRSHYLDMILGGAPKPGILSAYPIPTTLVSSATKGALASHNIWSRRLGLTGTSM